MWVNVSIPFECSLPLSNLLEKHLRKGSVPCISLRVSSQSSVSGGGAFTLSVVDASVGDVILVGLCVLLQLWVAGPSGVDATNMLIEAAGVAWVSLTSINYERQSAALLQAPDIHSNVMLEVASSRDHLFTLLLEFLPVRNFCKCLWSLWTTMSDPCR